MSIIPFLAAAGGTQGTQTAGQAEPPASGCNPTGHSGTFPPQADAAVLPICDTTVPWLSCDSRAQGQLWPAPAALVTASMGTSACQLWKVPALLRSCLDTYNEPFFFNFVVAFLKMFF